MNFKRKSGKRGLWRKNASRWKVIHEWSRMLHLHWKRDTEDRKKKFYMEQ